MFEGGRRVLLDVRGVVPSELTYHGSLLGREIFFRSHGPQYPDPDFKDN